VSLVAFIPARAGSKGIPGKNMVDLAGVPLIHHTLAAAQASRYIDRIFLTTDSDEIIAYARSLGMDVPYKRPAELAGDSSSMLDAVTHGLDWLEAQGETYDNLILLQPTSPLRTTADIDGAYEMFLQKNATSLTSVHEMGEHPFECTVGLDNGWDYLAHPPRNAVRRQDYNQRFFFINGAVYIVAISSLRNTGRFVIKGETVLYEMPSERGVDIDTQQDMLLARHILSSGAHHA